jgi:tetratricopeptide (TPR) repeat protein
MARPIPPPLTPQGEPGAPASRLRAGWAVAAAVLAVFAVKLVALWQLAAHPLLQPRGVLDDAVYLRLAQRVAGGDLALGPDVYYLSPFYTYFLGLIFALGGSVFTARLVQSLLGVGAVVLIGLTARSWSGDRAGWIAAAAAALTGLFTFNEILLLQSSVDPFLSALALWLLARAVRRERVLDFLAAGASLGLLVVNRPNTLAAVGAVVVVFVVVFVFAGLNARAATSAERREEPASVSRPPGWRWPSAWRGPSGPRSVLIQAAALLLGTALVVSPFTIRNRLVAGEWTPVTSHGGLNFYIGNHEGANGLWNQLPGISPSIEGQSVDAGRVASEAIGHRATAGEASDYYYSLGWRWIREHPLDAATLWLRKAALTFSATDLALNYSFTYYSRDESTVLAFLVVGPWLLVPFGLVGLVLRLVSGRADRPAFAAWAAFLPGYAASLVVFFVASRYRLPLLAMLCTGAGIFVAWAATTVGDRNWRLLLWPVVGLVALFAVTFLPLEADTGRMYERGERIVQLITAGQDEQAERLLAATEPGHPARGLLLYRCGRAWQERGDHARAIAAFERALAADPGQPDIRSSLGEELLAAGRPADAIPHLQAARDAGLDVPARTLDLARAFASLGRRDEAWREVEGLLRERDADPQDVLALAADALRGGDLAMAEGIARRAAARWPGSSAAQELLGMALMLQDRRVEGQAALESAVRLDPRSATAHYHLALALAQAGRLEDAARLAEETLRLEPDYPEARELLGKLRR